MGECREGWGGRGRGVFYNSEGFTLRADGPLCTPLITAAVCCNMSSCGQPLRERAAGPRPDPCALFLVHPVLVTGLGFERRAFDGGSASQRLRRGLKPAPQSSGPAQ